MCAELFEAEVFSAQRVQEGAESIKGNVGGR